MTRFYFPVRNGGLFQDGLANILRWGTCRDIATATSVASYPVFHEVESTGIYYFEIDEGEAIFGYIDAGSTVPNPYERYIYINASDVGTAMTNMTSSIADVVDALYNDRETVGGTYPLVETLFQADGVTPKKVWRLERNRSTETRKGE